MAEQQALRFPEESRLCAVPPCARGAGAAAGGRSARSSKRDGLSSCCISEFLISFEELTRLLVVATVKILFVVSTVPIFSVIFPIVFALTFGSAGSAFAQTPVTEVEGGLEVLPFSDISGQPGDQWIGTGIADTLVADLVPLSTAGSWRVRGAYQRVGDQIRITADLVRSDSGTVMTSVKVDGVFAELFDLQNRLSAPSNRDTN